MSDDNQYGSIENMDDYIERRFELNEWMNRNSKARIVLYVNVLLDRLDGVLMEINAKEEDELYRIIDLLTEPPIKELESIQDEQEEEDNE